MTGRLFVDRRAAGRRLAEALGALLRKHPEITDLVLLSLPRGGVPMATSRSSWSTAESRRRPE